MSQAAALSMNHSRFAPVSGTTVPATSVSTIAASRHRAARGLLRLGMKLSRRTRIVSTGLLMVAASFGLSMLVVALNAL